MSTITLAVDYRVEQEVKKSRFIANAVPLASPDDYQLQLERLRDPAATHNCWAYRVGDAYRFSDDGEPGGTAGRPILAAIEGQGVDGVLVVVTRYFGGIKLGAGGLVRAYGGAAAECLRQAPKIEVRELVEARLTVPFDLTGVLYNLIEKHGAEKLGEEYASEGLVLRVSVEESRRQALEADAVDATRGKVRIQWFSDEKLGKL